jgi:hypothetical protein
VHDYLCTIGIGTHQISSRDADGVFRRVLRELDVLFAQRWMMWAGVRWGAAVSGDRARTLGLVRDLPLVLLISAGVLPIVLPGVAGVTVGLGLYALLRLLAGRVA